jgi:hypothetical protein
MLLGSSILLIFKASWAHIAFSSFDNGFCFKAKKISFLDD